MAEHPSLDDLRSIDVLRDLAIADVEWLRERTEIMEGRAGEIVIKAGEPAEYMFLLFSGEIRGELPESGQVLVAGAGTVGGLLPFSRLTHSVTNLYATKDSRGGKLHKRYFPEMLQAIPVLAQRLVALMSDRIRESTRAELQHEKLLALGRLSAGLAHELNNPAAAGQSAASSLRRAVKDFRMSTTKLAKLDLPEDALNFLIGLESQLADKSAPGMTRESLDRSDDEERLAAWLARHGVAEAWTLAPDLVDAGCTQATLERVISCVPKEYLSATFSRLTGSLTITRLVSEIESSMKRVSDLVRAVKDYSYMDQMPEQEVDIHDGIDTTLLILKPKLKSTIEVVREYDRSIPRITVRGSELNLVWTNLITNAVEAMREKGTLRLTTKSQDGKVLVDVADNGAGIPAEIRNRIFEPFFTTKGVNEGTGLGLDIAARAVRNHGGTIQVDSKPGRTVFSVRLPIDYGVRRFESAT